MSLLLNTLSRLVITFLPRSKGLILSWLQSPSAVILEPKKVKSATVSPSISHELMGAIHIAANGISFFFMAEYYSTVCVCVCVCVCVYLERLKGKWQWTFVSKIPFGKALLGPLQQQGRSRTNNRFPNLLPKGGQLVACIV